MAPAKKQLSTINWNTCRHAFAAKVAGIFVVVVVVVVDVVVVVKFVVKVVVFVVVVVVVVLKMCAMKDCKNSLLTPLFQTHGSEGCR